MDVVLHLVEGNAAVFRGYSGGTCARRVDATF